MVADASPAPHIEQHVRHVRFAGDSVYLAGQIEYPHHPMHNETFPLVFILQHAAAHKRSEFNHYAQTALQAGYAVFRWDKRGTGHSGAGGRGSTTKDALLAYQTALKQPYIDQENTVIIAQCEASILLANNFKQFATLQAPIGVLLVGNMLSEDKIQAIDAPLQIILGAEDWQDQKRFGQEASAKHNMIYRHGASYFLATKADRLLRVCYNNRRVFHPGAEQVLYDWLVTL